MERLEEIKKKLRDYNAEVVASRGCCDTQDFSLDVAFLVVENERLLSLIDQYELQTESHEQVMTEKREMIELMVRKGIISPDHYLEVVNQVLYRKE